MFKIGQRVVCKETRSYNFGQPNGITKGEIYTIAGITNCPNCNSLLLELVEVLPMRKWCGECDKDLKTNSYYHASRFEPLKYDLLDNKDIISEIIEEKADIKIPELVEN